MTLSERPTRGGTPAYSKSNIDVLGVTRRNGADNGGLFEIALWEDAPYNAPPAGPFLVVALRRDEVREHIAELQAALDASMDTEASHPFRDDATQALYESIRHQVAIEAEAVSTLVAAAVTTSEREALQQRIDGIERGWYATQVAFGTQIRPVDA